MRTLPFISRRTFLPVNSKFDVLSLQIHWFWLSKCCFISLLCRELQRGSCKLHHNYRENMSMKRRTCSAMAVSTIVEDVVNIKSFRKKKVGVKIASCTSLEASQRTEEHIFAWLNKREKDRRKRTEEGSTQFGESKCIHFYKPLRSQVIKVEIPAAFLFPNNYQESCLQKIQGHPHPPLGQVLSLHLPVHP